MAAGSGVGQALAVLAEVARHGPGVSANELAKLLGLPRTTAYRLINSLAQDEYLVRMPDLQGFALGARVVELAHLIAPAPLERSALQLLDRLGASLGSAVHLAAFEGWRIALRYEDPRQPLTDRRAMQRDLRDTALGRLMLAERWNEGQRWSGAGAGTDEVESIAVATARLGYARQRGRSAPDRGCIAVAVRDASGALIGALAAATTAADVERLSGRRDDLQRAALRLAPLLAL